MVPPNTQPAPTQPTLITAQTWRWLLVVPVFIILPSTDGDDVCCHHIASAGVDTCCGEGRYTRCHCLIMIALHTAVGDTSRPGQDRQGKHGAARQVSRSIGQDRLWHDKQVSTQPKRLVEKDRLPHTTTMHSTRHEVAATWVIMEDRFHQHTQLEL